ncbi:MAG: FAD-dependent oxidoreductase [Desulfobacteraceae bacterium]|jgi:ferredoxin-NADP reductase
MKRIVHPIAGAIAILLISTFWLSTALSELFASQAVVTAVKIAIPWGFLLLIPALIATAGSGVAIAKGIRKGVIGAKFKRMPFIAANGILILIPAAFYLASKARAVEFDTGFYAVQAIELVAGAANITLLALAMRDGLKMTKWRRGQFLKSARTATTKLMRQEDVASHTMAFYFKKPEGFEFTAGQAVYVTLVDPPEKDQGGRIRTFSIAGAPQEPELMIVTRMRDTSFKRVLRALAVGKEIEIEGPFGDLSLHKEPAGPVVFLAGGIGVTPFLSMTRDATQRGLSHRLFLFYSNRSPEDAAFLAELAELEKRNSRFKLIATMTDTKGTNTDWAGEKGYITKDMLLRHVNNLMEPVYYIAGPPAMVLAMEKILRDAGVKSEDIRSEMFSGY